jgi:hypothetical protein
MKNYGQMCRLCLKEFPATELLPLFQESGVASYKSAIPDWKRSFAYIYEIEGLPDKICTLCKSQIDFMLVWQKQIYENDCLLRFEYMKNQEMAANKALTKKPLKRKSIFIESPLDLEVSDNDSSVFSPATPKTSRKKANSRKLKQTPKKPRQEESTVKKPRQEESAMEEVGQPPKENEDDEIAKELGQGNGRVQRNKQAYKCGDCNSLFSNKRLYEQHKNTHKVQKHFYCYDCNQSFSTTLGYTRHKNWHARNTVPEEPINTSPCPSTFRCPLCDKCFSSKDLAKAHISNKHPDIKASPMTIKIRINDPEPTKRTSASKEGPADEDDDKSSN